MKYANRGTSGKLLDASEVEMEAAPFFERMFDDQDLGFFANSLGIFIFFMVSFIPSHTNIVFGHKTTCVVSSTFMKTGINGFMFKSLSSAFGLVVLTTLFTFHRGLKIIYMFHSITDIRLTSFFLHIVVHELKYFLRSCHPCNILTDTNSENPLRKACS
ncbi:hypothetical protein LXL04_018484 [Taraxacum kok-saghyz]